MNLKKASAEFALSDSDILLESPNFIAVNKPPGLLSIPGQNPREPNLLRSLARRFPNEQILVIHRIDRETSGVILFARNEEAHRTANGWFSSHIIKKEYQALASGSPRMPALRVNHPVDGKASLSQVQIVERYSAGEETGFLARVRIATGRRHQIRVHLQAEGFPILGDTRYGGARSAFGISFPRVALHAEKLVVPKSDYSDAVELVAPLPTDFNSWISSLRAASQSS